MAGRPPKPTSLKLVQGNPGKRALNKQEPDPDYLADLTPPSWLTDAAADVWVEEAPKFRAARLLTECDVLAFAALCQAAADYRRATLKTGDADVKVKLRETEDGDVVETGEHLNPWAMVKSMSFKQLMVGLEKFGGTPQARTRLAVQPQGSLFDDDKASKYF